MSLSLIQKIEKVPSYFEELGIIFVSKLNTGIEYVSGDFKIFSFVNSINQIPGIIGITSTLFLLGGLYLHNLRLNNCITDSKDKSLDSTSFYKNKKSYDQILEYCKGEYCKGEIPGKIEQIEEITGKLEKIYVIYEEREKQIRDHELKLGHTEYIRELVKKLTVQEQGNPSSIVTQQLVYLNKENHRLEKENLVKELAWISKYYSTQSFLRYSFIIIPYYFLYYLSKILQLNRYVSQYTGFSTMFFLELLIGFLYQKKSKSKRILLSQLRRNIIVLTILVESTSLLYLPFSREILKINNRNSNFNATWDLSLISFFSTIEKIILSLIIHDTMNSSSYGYYGLFLGEIKDTLCLFSDSYQTGVYHSLYKTYNKSVCNFFDTTILLEKNSDSIKLYPKIVYMLYLIGKIGIIVIISRILSEERYSIISIGTRTINYSTRVSSLNHSFISTLFVYFIFYCTQFTLTLLIRIGNIEIETSIPENKKMKLVDLLSWSIIKLKTHWYELTRVIGDKFNKDITDSKRETKTSDETILQRIDSNLSQNVNTQVFTSTYDYENQVSMMIIGYIFKGLVSYLLSYLFLRSYLKYYYVITNGSIFPVEIESSFKEIMEIEANKGFLRGEDMRSSLTDRLVEPLLESSGRILNYKLIYLLFLKEANISTLDILYTESLILSRVFT